MRDYLRLVAPLVLLATGCDPNAPPAVAPVAVPPEPPREEIDNPQYRAWSRFPEGTTVVHRSVTRTEGTEGETVTTTTSTLTQVSSEQVVVEVRTETRRYDGLETKTPARKYTHSRRVPAPPNGPSAEPKDSGQETVSVAGKEYHSQWHKSKDRNEGGEVLAQVWLSAEVPGGLLKSQTRTPALGKTTMTELVAVRGP